MRYPRVVITAPSSGEGKTIVSIALMAAFHQRGYRVQGFKIGPDYIDPSYYLSATSRVGRNLDVWMEGTADNVVSCFVKGMIAADLGVVEGVMGYFDGHDPLSNDSSTYHVASLLHAPVLFVLNGEHSARSAAAVVLGFRQFASPDYLSGVLITRIKSARHYELLRGAIESEIGIRCYGFLSYHDDLVIAHRQLGIVPAGENSQTPAILDRLIVESVKTIDLEGILTMMTQAPELDTVTSPTHISVRHRPAIAIAADLAFNFYYQQNLELLEDLGARLLFFSPLAGDEIPEDAQALYMGGGFPEEFSSQLASCRQALEGYRDRIATGLPTLAECGGYMLLAEKLIDTVGREFPMAGIIPHTVVMDDRLQAVGYRTVTMLSNTLFKAGTVFRGHEFHYSHVVQSVHPRGEFAYTLKGRRDAYQAGYVSPNVLGGYAHLYFPSNISALKRWIESLSKQL